ncbi:hypothetical protein BJX62DRAFT_223676 [Aspergillus germanicus]
MNLSTAEVIVARSLMRSSYPFVDFSEVLVQSLQDLSDEDESLINLSASGTGRNVKMRLRGFVAQTNHKRLYSKDLHFPQEWIMSFETLLPSALRHLGSLDLFRVLPKEVAPEALMAYVGTRKLFSEFPRCFSATVAPRSADFPIYVTDQGPGDLVIFPSGSAHQVWNVSSMVTRVVGNIMHTSSLGQFFGYVQPGYPKQCHPDTGRVPLIPVYALQSDSLKGEDARRLLEIFRSLVDDEYLGQRTFAVHQTVDTQGAMVECDFCGLTIRNRHLHCGRCGDFDLCLTCFISGRSCKHAADYTWAGMIPRSICENIVQAVETRFRLGLGLRPTDRSQSLGPPEVSAMDARQQLSARLCHLCRDSHRAWKSTLNVDIISFLKSRKLRNCPRCSHICNCRCCHLSEPYQNKDKPLRARIEPIDPRGRMLGFVDNLFDQKRDKRASLHTTESKSADDSVLNPRDSTTPDRNNPKHTPRVSDPPFRSDNQVETQILTPEQSSRQLSRSTQDLNISLQASSTDTRDKSVSRRYSVPSEEVIDNTDNPGAIPAMERRLHTLRQHADDLTKLGLIESCATIEERIAKLNAELGQLKRSKAQKLLRNLDRDFPKLAGVAKEEARRL